MDLRSPVIYIIEPYGGSIRRHNAALPMVFGDDAAVTRGDGVFETLLIRHGKPLNLDRHLARFRDSASLMNLPDPAKARWVEATQQAVDEWSRLNESSPGRVGDAQCVWTYSRGRESTGIPSAWLTVKGVGEHIISQRKHGVKVMTASRGYSIHTELAGTEGGAPGDESSTAPWLAVGAKTLNYAANMAALRYAHAHGFDDVIYTDPSTGCVLEGATSTVVTVREGGKLRTPLSGGNVLAGTTQSALFEYATEQGWRCKAKPMLLEQLFDAQSVWLVGSVRVATRVTSLNGEILPTPDNENEIRKLINKALNR